MSGPRLLRLLVALLLGILVPACASTRSKDGLLVPFAREGAPPALAPERRFALLIGVDRYDDPRFPELRYAAKDARRLGAALQGFTEVKVLASAESTSRAEILAALKELGERIQSPNDTLVVYVSSHGTLAQRPGGALERVLVTRDTRMDLATSTGIPVDDLLSDLSQLPSRRKVVILATCHSGQGKSQLSDPLSRALSRTKGPPVPLAARSEALIVLTACAFGETAREDDGLGHDIYTAFLLEALSRGDRDRDGAVTATEAHDWARERTYTFSRGLQRPMSESAVLGTDPIVLAGARVRAPLPVLYSYDQSADGLAVEVDGRRKGTLPGGVAVEPGLRDVRLVEVASGKTVFSGAVRVDESAPIDLSSALPQPMRVGLSFEGAASLPALARSRDSIPLLGGGGLAAELRGGTRGAWWGRLSVRGAAGTGEAPGLERRIPFTEQAAWVSLSAGHRTGVGVDLAVAYGGEVGWLGLWRQLRLDGYEADQAAGAPTTGVVVGLEWDATRHLGLGLFLQASAYWGDLRDGSVLHPLVSVVPRATWSW